MCAACDGHHERVPTPTAAAWAAAVARARAAVDEGTLELVEGPALEPSTGRRRHVLQCATCGQLFLLERRGDHVLGDGWRPLHGN